MSEFKGFSPDLKVFFEQLSQNNNKEWFYEHKPEYLKFIKEPSIALVQTLSQLFAEMNLPFIADTKASLFRINRDIRFSKDKSPYKTNLGVYFPYSPDRIIRKVQDSVGMYFHVDFNDVFISGGVYQPSMSMLQLIRKKINNDYDILQDLENNPQFIKEFPSSIYGDSLKKVPQGYSAEHNGIKYLKMKHFLADYKMEHKQIYSEQIIDIIIKKAIGISPFLEFLHLALFIEKN